MNYPLLSRLRNLLYNLRELYNIIRALLKRQVIYSDGKYIYYPIEQNQKENAMVCSKCGMVSLREKYVWSLPGFYHDLGRKP